MPKRIVKNILFPQIPENIGKVQISWTFPEFTKYKRSKRWYFIVAIIIAGFLAYSVYVMNFLFAIIILLFVFIAVYQHYQEPRKIEVQITDRGILVDAKFFNFKELNNFWFVYEPPVVKNLYIDFRSKLKNNLTIPLEKTNPLKVREILSNYINEDFQKDTEALEEIFARFIKY